MPNSTFIIPVKIDSDIRLKNVHLTLKYLLHHTDSIIKIIEADETQKLFLNKNDRVSYNFQQSPATSFHRTRLINEMLTTVETPITVNYDADVLLEPNAYKNAEALILNKDIDVVYPYGFEQYDQRMLSPLVHLNTNFYDNMDLFSIQEKYIQIGYCRFGHVQFFKTSVYRSGFMENENYQHWCPEDEERGIRFVKLGYKVIWFKNLIYHQEHPPSSLAPPSNRHAIYELHDQLLKMNKEEITKYYLNQDYIKKYANS